jgi:acetyltransferase-like isoleucine patch superfamily enzyme
MTRKYKGKFIFIAFRVQERLPMKKFVKKLVQIIALVLVFPLYALMFLCELLVKTDEPFQGFSQFLSLFPGVPGNYFRQQFYRLALVSCSNDCCIEFGTCFSQRGTELGRRVYIGANCSIGLCRIDDDVMLGSNVDIISGKKQHLFESLDIPMREQGGELDKIVIGEDCWLGNSSVIMANIGKKSIVAAGSVVVKEVPPFNIVGGNPARILRSRLDDASVDRVATRGHIK